MEKSDGDWRRESTIREERTKRKRIWLGKTLNAVASRNVKVLVVGNPCNTNALICLKNAPNISAKNFHALTRLDENRAECQTFLGCELVALKAGVFYDKVSNMTI
ncbi:unnamed protein product [Musa hybrid cultivar]